MIKYLLAIMLVLVGCGGTPKLSHLPPDAVVLAFGDSLTYGTGVAEADSYPAVLEGLIGRKVVRSGVPGEVTADSLARLPTVLDEANPKLMVLCIGGNDIMRRMSEQQAADNIRAMVRLAKSKGVDVVLVGVPQLGITMSAPAFYADIAKEFKLPYEIEVMRKIFLSKDLKSDEVHPNAQGYKLFAEAVAALLKKAGAV
ncbi:MAG: GDSL-type esterase/lipase family protein [Candidatus Methylumidiphilus sp.]